MQLINENIQEGFTKEWLARLINEYFHTDNGRQEEKEEKPAKV